MPHSHPFGKSADLAGRWYADLRPGRVLELGPGAGMWAAALRPLHRGHWTGVEIWEPYVARYGLAAWYDEIIIGDVRTVELPAADLVIAGDILEHMTPGEATDLVARIRATGSALLVSVPVIEYHQGAIEGNPHETHLWHPTDKVMREWLRPDHAAVGDVVGVYWCDPAGATPQTDAAATAHG